jgi:type I restriction enzyme R subunit
VLCFVVTEKGVFITFLVRCLSSLYSVAVRINMVLDGDLPTEGFNFVLDKYVEDGVGELSSSKMKSLINLKYSTIDDAADALGSVQVIRETFVGFQQYLYQT